MEYPQFPSLQGRVFDGLVEKRKGPVRFQISLVSSGRR